MSPRELTIRRATPDDADVVLECLRRAFEPFRGRYTKEACEDTVLTRESQRAMAFYERRGYRRTCRVNDFYGMPLDEYARRLI